MAANVKFAVVAGGFGNQVATITDLGATATAVSASAGSVFLVKIDNHRNQNDPVFVKIYNSASPTVGSDIPIIIMMAPPGQGGTGPNGEDLDALWCDPLGAVFGTAISAACVTAAGTAGDVSPANAVDVTIYI